MQYKTPARPPLDRRGKNETEIQIYSRKSELHRARGTPTHKMKKSHGRQHRRASLKNRSGERSAPLLRIAASRSSGVRPHAHRQAVVERKKCVHIFLLFTIFMCVSGLRASGTAASGGPGPRLRARRRPRHVLVPDIKQ